MHFNKSLSRICEMTKLFFLLCSVNMLHIINQFSLVSHYAPPNGGTHTTYEVTLSKTCFPGKKCHSVTVHYSLNELRVSLCCYFDEDF